MGVRPLGLYIVTRLTRHFLCRTGKRVNGLVFLCIDMDEEEEQMGFIEMLLIAVSMSMDAFAVSVCKGLSVRQIQPKHALSVGLWFGGFQGLMPVIGFALTALFSGYIESVSSYIAFALLAFIGVNMIREALSREEEEIDDSFGFRTMLTLAIATSIDALAVGVTLNLEHANILIAAPLIAVTTGVLSPIGLKVGNLFGARYKSRAELVGGLVLVGLAVKFLLAGLGILG